MSKNPKGLRVPYALAVHGEEEEKRVLAVLREHRTNTGRETREFEEHVPKLFGKKYGIMVNSGSSANLLAFELLNLPEGSEVITPLLTFSTTVAPIIQKKLIPVFADVEQGKYIVNLDQVEKLISKKTKALMIPLLLGNVPDMKRLHAIAKRHNLFLVEDSCDTLGPTFDKKHTGFYTDITTTSFFGSHIITAGGNGGMIMVNRSDWKDKAKVLRGWGRSSALFGETENIDMRFRAKVGGMPYDAKFVFDAVGYNMLPVEMASAFGNVQLKKLPRFRKIRERNFAYLHRFFKTYEDLFILPIQDKLVKTQWITFPLTISKTAPFKRLELVKYLEENNIQTRPIFAGNILKQSGFKNIQKRVLNGNYPFTNEVMERGFVIGCHQGLEKKHLIKIEEVFKRFLKKYL
ncbi:MAG: DegT/DnrJ/EryC1/StrS family aminotransferase [Patescibacteria group bacterium]|nr:DegT/DnrJ/EryC1/StrS family aminotransferase [Patescibacteria group bacterium]MCL6096588.1 DegT/DnrJ/EryC1/StrS family aminotransferase [Patescibacteria group bacterium]